MSEWWGSWEVWPGWLEVPRRLVMEAHLPKFIKNPVKSGRKNQSVFVGHSINNRSKESVVKVHEKSGSVKKSDRW